MAIRKKGDPIMSIQEAIKKLKEKAGRNKWLCRESSGEFYILTSEKDPFWSKKAIWLGTVFHIEIAAKWIMEA